MCFLPRTACCCGRGGPEAARMSVSSLLAQSPVVGFTSCITDECRCMYDPVCRAALSPLRVRNTLTKCIAIVSLVHGGSAILLPRAVPALVNPIAVFASYSQVLNRPRFPRCPSWATGGIPFAHGGPQKQSRSPEPPWLRTNQSAANTRVCTSAIERYTGVGVWRKQAPRWVFIETPVLVCCKHPIRRVDCGRLP